MESGTSLTSRKQIMSDIIDHGGDLVFTLREAGVIGQFRSEEGCYLPSANRIPPATVWKKD